MLTFQGFEDEKAETKSVEDYYRLNLPQELFQSGISYVQYGIQILFSQKDRWTLYGEVEGQINSSEHEPASIRLSIA